MLKRYVTSFFLLSVFLIGLTGCSLPSQTACNQVTLSYPSSGGGGTPYLMQVYMMGTKTVIGTYAGTVAAAGGTITIPLNKSYPAGTWFTIEIIIVTPFGPFPIGSFSTGGCTGGNVGSWFEPGDGRINRQAYASAVVYCDAAENRVSIYGVEAGESGSNAHGFPAIFVPYNQLPPVPSAEAGHTLIATYRNIRFYRLTTGEYQINVGPDDEGKEYVAVWDGCPQTVVKTYIFQDGVQTMTEIYPHD